MPSQHYTNSRLTILRFVDYTNTKARHGETAPFCPSYPAPSHTLFAGFRLTGPRSERLVALLAGLLGAAGGALVQIAWLSDDSPQLNWTLPEPHHFNTAGRYHAVFLVLISGTLAAAWMVVIMRWIYTDNWDQQLRMPALATAIAALATTAFALLLLTDNDAVPLSRAAAASLLGAGAFGTGLIASAIIAWRVRRRRKLRS